MAFLISSSRASVTAVGAAACRRSKSSGRCHRAMSAAAAGRVAILGAPGSGKGTLSSRLVEDFSFTHIASGDLLRREIAQQSALGKKAEGYIKDGAMVPDSLVVDLVMQTLHGETKVLLDGFPRSLDQAKQLDEQFPMDVVLNLDVPEPEIMKRLENRRVHVPSGRVYHLLWNPPKVDGLDDETGEDLVHRADDTQASIVRRLEQYRELNAPLVEYYKDRGVLQTFSGTESNVIYPEMKRAVGAWLAEQ